MAQKKVQLNRRGFLKKIGAVSAAPFLIKLSNVWAATEKSGESNEPNLPDPNSPPEIKSKIPLRNLGKTGIKVPCLSLGANRLDSIIILKAAIQNDVTYFDTASSYVGGNSEATIGKLLESDSKLRKKIFLATKASQARTPEQMEQLLRDSLENMKTDYVDLYHFHGLSDPSAMTDDLKKWVEKVKKEKKIKFFGFSTHSNMPQCMTAAAKLGWVDAIMTSYNFRLMLDDDMKKAVDTCQKAGVGLIAMKTLGLRVRGGGTFTDEEKKVYQHFVEKGYTELQARIKSILQDGKIASACIGMKSVSELQENIKAVTVKKELTRSDRQVLRDYARSTKSDYCAGCAEVCSPACPEMPYIAEVMRYMMYYNSYGDLKLAKENFAMLPAAARAKLLTADYSLAEKRCPNSLPIAKIIHQAAKTLV